MKEYIIKLKEVEDLIRQYAELHAESKVKLNTALLELLKAENILLKLEHKELETKGK